MNKNEKIKLFRSRFYGRQDVYGRQWLHTKPDGTIHKGYAPKCKNFWTDRCHIKTRSGTTCTRCEIKEYDSVSDESVWRHISGEEAQLQYLVQDDGTVKFWAMDYDFKVGKEDQGYTFEDVKIVSSILTEEGITHGVARSTGNGYHLYVFMEDFYPALKVRAISFWIAEKAGFLQQMRQGIRPLFETFPKNNHASPSSIGNGIKPPMIETRWAEERNGFVDGINNFIEDQWAYLASIPLVKPKQLDDLIEKYEIEVEDDSDIPEAGSTTRRNFNKEYGCKSGKWQQPLTGSYEKVIEGCSALRKIFDKASKGTTPGHQEGFAAFHIAMSTRDGLEVFKQKMTGWGQTDKDIRQLEHSIGKDYAPWSCKKMQEAGICVPGTKCFDKKPPLALVEGHYVQLTDVPEDQWPDPSPIRYGFGKGEDFLEKLKKEVDDLSGEPDENRKGNLLREIAKRAQVFDEDQQRALREYIKGKKVIRSPELTKMFNKAEAERTKETKAKASTRSDSVIVGNTSYQIFECGYSVLKSGKDGDSWVTLCNYHINIEEIKMYLDDDVVSKTVFQGTFKACGLERKFEIDVNEWADNGDFVAYFLTVAPTHFNPMKGEVDHIKQAAHAFSQKKGIKMHNKLITQGWYQGTYLMPGIQVDKDGIRPNTEKEVDLSTKSHASFLEFKILPDDEFRQVLFHIKNDFMNAWPRLWTTIGLSHALLPALVTPLKIRKKPTLFYEGLTGSGKTELCHTLQHFWGEFESLLNLSSTGKGIMSVSHDFKDALLVLDDYKGLDYTQIASLQRVIQYSYDPTTRAALRSDSSMQKLKSSRATLLFTGESFLSNDAAMVARTVLIEVDKQDTTATEKAYRKCLEMRKNYCGITPHFIHWFLLTKETKEVINSLQALENRMYDRHRGEQNANRVAYNAALNHAVYALWCEFMTDCGVCSVQEREELITEHLGYIVSIQDQMMGRCAEEQNGKVFLDVLNQLIASASVVVEGVNAGDETRGRPIVGFCDVFEGRKVINIYPQIAYKVVIEACRENKIRGTIRELGRQFVDMGFSLGVDDSRYTRQLRKQNARHRVWCLLAESVWPQDCANLSVVQGGKAVNDTGLPPYHMAIPTPENPF